MNYAYTNIKKPIQKLFFGKKKTKKNLSACIKNGVKWTNRNHKLIKILKHIVYNYINKN